MMLLARASAGLVLWTVGFSLLYALHGIACAGDGAAAVRWILTAAWVFLILAALLLVRAAWKWKALSSFDRKLTRASALGGLAAILVTGAPVAVTSTCG
jgi:hypothetical protein